MNIEGLRISDILTDTQRAFVIAKWHEGKAISAIAERYGVSRQTVNQTILRACKALRAHGIDPPPDRNDRACSVKKNGSPTICVTVDPQVLAEMVEG